MTERTRTWLPVVVLLLALPLAFALLRGCLPPIGARGQATSAVEVPVIAQPPAACGRCHPDEVSRWAASSHARAEGVDSAPSGGPPEGKPVRTIGVAPVVQFLVPGLAGRFQVTPTAWDPSTSTWFEVFDDPRAPGDWGHFTGGGMTWNSQCASCHNTDVDKGYNATLQAYKTKVGTIGVSCAACHNGLDGHGLDGNSGTPSPSTPDLDTCAACHARRAELTGRFRPGDAFLDHFAPQLVDRTDAYWPDGQIRGEDFEYTSFISSKKFAAGVGCGACHEPHSGGLRAPAKSLCLGCHPEAQAHEGHSDVAVKDRPDCVACHMPVTTYMQRDDRHDHGFFVPDPMTSKELGLPVACDRCHSDGIKTNRLTHARNTRAAPLTKGKAGDANAVPGLLAMLAQDQPAWRASAAAMLTNFLDDAHVREALVTATSDEDDLVRFAAAGALGDVANDPVVSDALRQLLTDSRRAVRVQAARGLRHALTPGSEAFADYSAYLAHNADTPQALLERGSWAYEGGNVTAAMADLSLAVQLDPRAPAARDTLAVVLSAAGRTAEAVVHLQTAVGLAPEDPELWFRLGLAHGGTGDLGAAREAFRHAVALDSRNVRVLYNLGVVASQLGDTAEAVVVLRQATALAPEDSTISYALAAALWHEGDKSGAARLAKGVLARQPDHAGAKALLGLP